MSRRRLLVAVLMTIAVAAAFVGTARAGGRECSDDQGVDRCAPNVQAGVHDLYDVASVVDLVGAGTYARRVFFVDGYRNDVLLISVLRPPGREPYLEVRIPRYGDTGREPLVAPLSPRLWERILSQSEGVTRPLPAVASPDEGEFKVCLHAWVYTVEMVDPRRLAPDTESRTLVAQAKSVTESPCDNGPVAQFASWLAETALDSLPQCAELDLDDYRNDAMLLNACAWLRGDRFFAAQVLRAARPLVDLDGQGADRLQPIMDRETVLTLPEESPGAGNSGAPERLAAWASSRGSLRLHLDDLHAVDAETAVLRGRFDTSSTQGDRWCQSRAVTEVRWSRRFGRPAIVAMEVGPFTQPVCEQ